MNLTQVRPGVKDMQMTPLPVISNAISLDWANWQHQIVIFVITLRTR